jgi:hypothetical protein
VLERVSTTKSCVGKLRRKEIEIRPAMLHGTVISIVWRHILLRSCTRSDVSVDTLAILVLYVVL